MEKALKASPESVVAEPFLFNLCMSPSFSSTSPDI
jgi:hypothetical protein